MKVRMPENWKNFFTVAEAEKARALIASEKAEPETAKSWAEYAAREALKGTGDDLLRIIEADAEIAKNCRVWEAFGEGSGPLDIWVNFVAQTWGGFIVGGAYLSDIWESGATDYADHMFIKRAVYK